MRLSAGERLKPIFILLLLTALLLGLPQQIVRAQESDPQVTIHFFWGNTCPHCAKAKPFLEDLVKRYPQVELKSYEVYDNQANRVLFNQMAADYGVEVTGVPAFFIGDQYLVGFNEERQQQIEEIVKSQLGQGQAPAEPDPDVLNLPIIGPVDLSSQSLVLSTALIAFVDGFNPCSLWVLSMLMALVIHTGSRKKILLIGIIFLTVTAAIYAIFIAGLFSVLQIVSFMGWIQVAVAVLALVFAVINIKDYFFFKEGVSLTIADDKKGGIYRGIRRIISAESMWGLITATVAMAAGVSLVEFSCTAGFPVLWTNLLTAQGVGVSTFVLLLLLYLVIYQIDELVIFFTVVFTLKASRMEDKHGRILKLIGGSLMLTLAVVMLVNPALMNQLSSSLIIFAVAFGLAGLVLLVHRTILPEFGIWIGTEKPKRKQVRTVRRYKRH